MMNSNRVEQEINSLLDNLNRSELSILTNRAQQTSLRMRNSAKPGTRVTWMGANISHQLSAEPSIEDYKNWVGAQNCSAILYDGAILQITYDFDFQKNFVGHRLVYYPCPYDLDFLLLKENRYWMLLIAIKT